MPHKIHKAVIPVAGLGTRFLPATKAQPKEMLPIVDKPAIQYIVEEAVAAGIDQIIFVTSLGKRAIEDHFDRNFELEYRLRQQGKKKELGTLLDITDLAQFVYVRQRSPKGDGHAVLAAAHLVEGEPFVVLFGDDIVAGHPPFLSRLIEVYDKYHDPVLSVREVPRRNISRYGVVGGTQVEKGVYQIETLVEKPSKEKAPSNLAIFGRYLITPDLLEMLMKVKPGRDGEIRIIQAFAEYLKIGSAYARTVEGDHYDVGNKIGFLQANIEFALQHREVKNDFRKYLKGLKIK